jgi:hypothetical protein
MDIDKLIGELYAERMRLDAAIAALERAAAGGRKRRGRPPKWLAQIRAVGGSEDPKPSIGETGEASKK